MPETPEQGRDWALWGGVVNTSHEKQPQVAGVRDRVLLDTCEALNSSPALQINSMILKRGVKGGRLQCKRIAC